MASMYPNSPMPQKQMGGVPPQMQATMQGPGNLPPQYSTGTYAPQPSQNPQSPQQPMNMYAPPQSSQQAPPTGYNGVPVVVSGTPTNSAGATSAMNSMLSMGQAPINVDPLNAATQATLEQERIQAANAAAYGASAAFGQGASGTPVQAFAQNQVLQTMAPLNAQMMNTQANYYNQATQNQIAALQGAGQIGMSQADLALQAQMAQQNALFGANSQNLATQNQAFNQGMQSQDQAMQMYQMMYGMGAGATAMDQANMDAMYQMYGTNDPNQLIAMMSGAAPQYSQQQTPLNVMAPIMGGMMGYNMFNQPGTPQAGSNPNGGSYPVTQLPGGGYVNMPG